MDSLAQTSEELILHGLLFYCHINKLLKSNVAIKVLIFFRDFLSPCNYFGVVELK